jgi:biopolymer transport protein ExbD
MPIKPPGKRLGAHIALKQAQKHAKSRGKRAQFAGLMLTSMVDMFTLLVIFLLSNFSASGDLLLSAKDIKLPQAKSTTELERAVVVAVSPTTVTVEGEKVGDTAELQRNEDPRIPEMTDKLLERKRVVTQLMGADKFKGQIIIQADGEIDFKLIKKVMYSATEAGYGAFQYAVVSTGGGAPPPGEGHGE